MESEKETWIRAVCPDLVCPSLNDNTADVDRLVRGIGKDLETDSVNVEFSFVKRLPKILREYEYRIRAVLFEEMGSWHLMDIAPADEKGAIYGIAVDLGSSTVVVRLIDLSSRKTLDEASFHNPQIQIGADILTRIHFAAQKGGLEKLQSLFIERLNREIGRLSTDNGIHARSIAGMSVAGNTTMTHLFLGLDPYWICREPYIPVVNRPRIVRAAELDLAINSHAPVLVFPNVGSYFGGDLIAGILASGMSRHSETAFLVDVGTNAEVVIGNSDWLMACAGAAGPALEGGVASMGMMAAPGVIEKVIIDPDTGEFRTKTIDDRPAVGMCGSGLIDLVAQLFLTGMIDMRGKLVPGACRDRLLTKEGIVHLVVVPSESSGTGEPLTLNQPDIDALMRSKAAMYTILTTISSTVNIPLNDIGKFYVAGTFGSYIDPKSAITIGMIPDLPLDRYIPLGNTSLEGASMALVSAKARDEAFLIRDQITYMELNVNQEFMNLFSAAKFIPHTDRSLFPSVNPVVSQNAR
jgi:uncharacterized 2Fe-2S/4Fe-4S cluster protein (DUF4445 family)